MKVLLPDIIFEEKYKDKWEWDGWKPKAKVDAPQELRDEIDEWLKDVARLREGLKIKLYGD